MRFGLLILFILSTFIGQSQSDQIPRFPKYQQVFEQFYKDYGPREGTYVEFAKKPKGYYVQEKSLTTMKVVKEYLFWSLEKNAFLSLDKDLLSTAEKPNFNSYYGAAYSFDHALYYNYPEAGKDAVNLLEGRPLSDTALEMLARGYSIKCDQLTGGRFGQGSPSNVRKMSPTQAKQFVEVGKKLCATYERLKQMNPNYETLIGKVQTKLSNEYIYVWFELEAAGYSELAQQFLPEDLYDPLLFNFAKNMLASCPENAILFTNGDNDTYPLYYLQEKFGYRKDVAVINSGLGGVPFYIDFFRCRSKLETTLSQHDYNNKLLEYIFLDNESTGQVFILDSLLLLLKDPDKSSLKVEDGMMDYLKFNGKEFKFPGAYILPAMDTSRARMDIITMSFNSNVLYLSDIFELDLIHTHRWKRPIAYARGSFSNVKRALGAAFDNMALVEILSPYQPQNNYGSYIDREKVDFLLTNTYTYGIQQGQVFQVQSVVKNYLNAFFMLAQDYLSDNKSGEVQRLLQESEQLILLPAETGMPDIFITYGMLWYNSGNKDKGHTYLVFALEEIERMRHLVKNKYDREELFSTAEAIERFTEEHKMVEVHWARNLKESIYPR